MFRFANCFVLLLPLVLCFSCQQPFKTEKEEMAFWGVLATDSSLSKLYRYRDTTESLQFFDAAVEKAKVQSYFTKAARFNLLANYFYFFSNDNEKTAGMIDSALAAIHTPGLQNRYPRTYVGYLLFGGQLAYSLQQYNKANEYYFKAKTLGDAHLNPCERKDFNYSIAMVLYHQLNFSQSLHYFKEAFALQNTCRPQTGAIALQQQEIQSNIGLCFVELGQPDSALVYFDNALKIANRYKDSLGPANMDKIYGVLYGHMAQVYMAKNNLKLAEQLCLKSIRLNARPGFEKIHAQKVRLQLADVYDKQDNHAAMLQTLQHLRSELDVLPKPHVELGWRRLMSRYYEQTGATQKALSIFKSYVHLRDSLNEQQKNLSAADVTRQFDVKQKELQIAILKKDNHIAFISLCVTIGASLMTMVILALIYQNYRRNKKSLSVSLQLNEEIRRQKKAREAEAKLRHKAITEAVIQAQENERALIGLELHDNINQVLTTVKLHNEMVLEGMGDPKVLLPRASRYLQECITEIRSLSKRLSAPSLGKISLEESVNDLLDTVNVTNKVTITRKITGFNHKLLSQDLHVGIYRILQEQLNNILKHAKATEVFVALERKDDSIRLFVADNGQGFAANHQKEGIGLVNMQTRAENLNGTFTLNSAPGAGCRVEVVVPLPESTTQITSNPVAGAAKKML